jgi:hypothetical protein
MRKSVLVCSQDGIVPVFTVSFECICELMRRTFPRLGNDPFTDGALHCYSTANERDIFR